MKKYILIILCMGILPEMFAQYRQIVGQYNLTIPPGLPAKWVSNGSASVEANSNRSFNVRGNFLIRTSETISLKANFNSNNCIGPADRNNYLITYPASGDVYIADSDDPSKNQHIKIANITIDFRGKAIRISKTDDPSFELIGIVIWNKIPSPD